MLDEAEWEHLPFVRTEGVVPAGLVVVESGAVSNLFIAFAINSILSAARPRSEESFAPLTSYITTFLVVLPAPHHNLY